MINARLALTGALTRLNNAAGEIFSTDFCMAQFKKLPLLLPLISYAEFGRYFLCYLD
jgi:hypothetical protein